MHDHWRPERIGALEQPAKQQGDGEHTHGTTEQARPQAVGPDPVGPVHGSKQECLEQVGLPEVHASGQLRQYEAAEHGFFDDRGEEDLPKDAQPGSRSSLQQRCERAARGELLKGEDGDEEEQSDHTSNRQPAPVKPCGDLHGCQGIVSLEPQEISRCGKHPQQEFDAIREKPPAWPFGDRQIDGRVEDGGAHEPDEVEEQEEEQESTEGGFHTL